MTTEIDTSAAPAAPEPVQSGVTAITNNEPKPEAQWFDTFNDDVKAIAQKYGEKKGYKSPEDFISGYDNLSRLMGVDDKEILRIPKEGDEKGMAEFRAKMGVPDSVDGYDYGEADVAEELKGPLREFAHKHNLNNTQLLDLVTWANETIPSLFPKDQERNPAEELAELERTWGQDYKKNEATAKHAYNTVMVSEFGDRAGDVLTKIESAIGTSDMMNLLRAFGRQGGEPSFFASNEVRTTKQEAQAKLNDPEFRRKVMSGDPAANKQRMEFLAIANG